MSLPNEPASRKETGSDYPAQELLSGSDPESIWGKSTPRSDMLVRNVSMTYLAKGVDIVIGVVMLPLNIAYLGPSVYGLWMIAASIPAYFSILDLGYGVAQVKFVSRYRASGDVKGVNETVSTLFVVFAIIGVLVLIIAALVALNLETLFGLREGDAELGRQVLMLMSLYAAIGFPLSVFGGVVNGFQRFHLNAYVSIATSIVVAVVNAVVLLSGYGLVALVAAVTAVRLLAYVGYRANAYRAFPALSLRPRYVNMQRLREVTGFTSFMLLIDVANKLNYSTDVPIIGAFLGPRYVAVWAVAQRLISITQDLTTQVSGALFPVVVDIATLGETAKLRQVFIQGTRLSFAMVIPIATTLALLAVSLVTAWVGPDFLGSVPVIWILAAAVIVRVGNSTATTVLKGANEHSFLAKSNMAMALMNVGLSIILVRSIGLLGVAWATLASVFLFSVFVLFPRACRRVEIPISNAVWQGVWPSIWPMLPPALLLLASRSVPGSSLVTVGLQAVAAAILYTALFLFFAISGYERRQYFGKIKSVVSRQFGNAATTQSENL